MNFGLSNNIFSLYIFEINVIIIVGTLMIRPYGSAEPGAQQAPQKQLNICGGVAQLGEQLCRRYYHHENN